MTPSKKGGNGQLCDSGKKVLALRDFFFLSFSQFSFFDELKIYMFKKTIKKSRRWFWDFLC